MQTYTVIINIKFKIEILSISYCKSLKINIIWLLDFFGKNDNVFIEVISFLFVILSILKKAHEKMNKPIFPKIL